MMLSWMIRIAFATLLVALAAWSAERALRHGLRACRWVWVSSVLAVVMFVVVSRFWPGWMQPVASSTAPLAILAQAQPAGSASGGFLISVVPLTRYAGVFWTVSSAIALLVYASGWYQLNRLKRRCSPGVMSGARVLISKRAGPAAVGLLQADIVVPAWLLNASKRARRLVLLHEAEHLRAGDHVLLGLAPLAAVAMPWNLPLWWMIRALRLSIEVDCDRRVLSRGVPAADYGRVLIDIAGHRGAAFALALASPRSKLADRLVGLTADVSRARVLVWSAVAASFILVAGSSAPTSPWVYRRDVLLKLPFSEPRLDPAARYEIDGVPATFEQALAQRPEDVRSIEVVALRTASPQPELNQKSQTVRLRTRATARVARIQPIRLEGEPGGGQVIWIRDNLALPMSDVRLLLDGHEVDGRQLEALDPAKIQSVRVIRRTGAKTEVALNTRQRA